MEKGNEKGHFVGKISRLCQIWEGRMKKTFSDVLSLCYWEGMISAIEARSQKGQEERIGWLRRGEHNWWIWEHFELTRNHWGNRRGCNYWRREDENSKAIKPLQRSEGRWVRASPHFLYTRLPSTISPQPCLTFFCAQYFLLEQSLVSFLASLHLLRSKSLPSLKQHRSKSILLLFFFFSSVAPMLSEKKQVNPEANTSWLYTGKQEEFCLSSKYRLRVHFPPEISQLCLMFAFTKK